MVALMPTIPYRFIVSVLSAGACVSTAAADGPRLDGAIPVDQPRRIAPLDAPRRLVPPDASTVYLNDIGGLFRASSSPSSYLEDVSLAGGPFPGLDVHEIELGFVVLAATPVVAEIALFDAFDPVADPVAAAPLGGVVAAFGNLAPGTYVSSPVALPTPVSPSDAIVAIRIDFRVASGGAMAPATPLFSGGGVAIGGSPDRFYADANADGLFSPDESFYFGGCSVLANSWLQVRGALPTAESEPNGSIGQADFAPCGSRVAGTLSPAADVDFFRFDLSSESLVTSEVLCGAADSTLRLRDGAGSEIEFDDDDGPGLCSLIARSLSAGTYFLEVREFGDNAAMPYSLSVRCERTGPDDEVEPNGTVATATPISCGALSRGRTSPAGDADLYRFEIGPADAFVTAQVYCGVSDSTLSLLDVSGVPIASSDDAIGLCSRISVLLSPGTYFLEVHEYGDDAVMTYGVSLSCSDPGYDEREPNGTLATANPIACGEIRRACVGSAGDVDYWRLELSEETHAVVSVDCGSGDSTLALRDATGAVVAFDDGSSGGCPEIVMELFPGVYFAEVREDGDDRLMPYSIVLSCAEPSYDEIEPNESLAGATGVQCGSYLSARVFPAGDADRYRLDLPGEHEVTATAACESGEATLVLLGADGLAIDSAPAGPSPSVSRALPPGSFFFEVREASGSAWMRYRLSVDCLPLTRTDEAEPNDTPSEANAARCGDALVARIQPRGDVDYWSLSAASPVDLSASVDTPDSVALRLLDGVGASIDSVPPGSPLTATLAPGSYFIEVREAGDDGTAEYRLRIDCAASDELEPNGPTPLATPIACRPSVRGRIDPPGEIDSWSIDVAGDGVIGASVVPNGGAVSVTLLDPSGNALAADSGDGSGGHPRLDAPVRRGRHVVRVRGIGAGEIGYRIDLDPETPECEETLVVGRVVLGTSAIPMRGVHVYLAGTDFRVGITDRTGQYSFANVKPGLYKVTACATHVEPATGRSYEVCNYIDWDPLRRISILDAAITRIPTIVFPDPVILQAGLYGGTSSWDRLMGYLAQDPAGVAHKRTFKVPAFLAYPMPSESESPAYGYVPNGASVLEHDTNSILLDNWVKNRVRTHLSDNWVGEFEADTAPLTTVLHSMGGLIGRGWMTRGTPGLTVLRAVGLDAVHGGSTWGWDGKFAGLRPWNLNRVVENYASDGGPPVADHDGWNDAHPGPVMPWLLYSCFDTAGNLDVVFPDNSAWGHGRLHHASSNEPSGFETSYVAGVPVRVFNDHSEVHDDGKRLEEISEYLAYGKPPGFEPDSARAAPSGLGSGPEGEISLSLAADASAVATGNPRVEIAGPARFEIVIEGEGARYEVFDAAGVSLVPANRDVSPFGPSVRGEEFVVTDASPGEFTVRLEAGSSEGARLHAAIAVPGGLRLRVAASPVSGGPGTPRRLDAFLVDGEGAVVVGSSGVFLAEVSRPDGTRDSVALADTGTGGDLVAGDGVHSAEYSGALESGRYELYASGRSLVGAEPLERTASTGFLAWSTAAAFVPGAPREMAPDDDGDGLLDGLVFEYDVVLERSGSFRLLATMLDAAGSPIAEPLASLDHDGGTAVIPFVLRVPGETIAGHGADGPYSLADCRLVDLSAGSIVADSAPNHESRAYRADAFEPPGLPRAAFIVPARGSRSGGIEITIGGEGLDSVTEVRLDGRPASVLSKDSSRLRFRLPPAFVAAPRPAGLLRRARDAAREPSLVDLTLVTPWGATVARRAFEYDSE